MEIVDGTVNLMAYAVTQIQNMAQSLWIRIAGARIMAYTLRSFYDETMDT